MRETFEKLAEIAEILKSGDIFFNDVYEAYGSKSSDDLTAGFVNGALYAYQEQQKRIDEYQAKLDEFLSELTKTEDEDKDNKADYWRGFAECAGGVRNVFLRDVGRLK